METFRIKVTQKVMSVEIYEIEAESKEEALELYCNELAGAIVPVESYTEEIRNDSVEDVIVID